MTLINDITNDTSPENDSKSKKDKNIYLASDQTREPGTVRIDENGVVWLKVRDD